MSACGVFNINSGDATGIQALRDVLSFRALYVLRRPLSSAPSEEGGAGSVPQAEDCHPGLPVQDSLGRPSQESELWSSSQ